MAAALICGFAGSEKLVASCSTSVIAYQASGTFGAKIVSGADKLGLAGEPFHITLVACESLKPTQTGSGYAAYTPIQLTGTVKSSKVVAPYTIPPTPMTLIVAQPVTGPDSVQVEGPLTVFGSAINIHASIALPAGALTSTSIAAFPTVSIVTANSGFAYSQGSVATELAVIGTAAGTVTPGAGPKADTLLHADAVEVIAAHADGTQSVRPLDGAPVDLLASSDKVMLQFYASGVRDASEVHVRIAGQDVPVLYSGASGHFPGLDEVVVELPRSLAGMGRVDVVLTADGQTASPVPIHIQ
jgi:hypothetical protein